MDILYSAAVIINNITENGLYREIGKKVTSNNYADGEYIFILCGVSSVSVYDDGTSKNKTYYEI